ncbi:MAG: ATP-binding domain-containing protein [Pseudomonadota bacterium]|nr:ATP-binding domain-containing protein [Pseudomonadota bacterium]
MITIVQGTTKKPIASKRLAEFFSKMVDIEGFLYLGYPIIGTAEGGFPIDALLVSKDKGLVVFNLIEGRDLDNYKDRLDDSFNKVESKLRSYKSLMKGRQLKVNIHPVAFAPAREDVETISSNEYPLCNEANLLECLEGFDWGDSSNYEALVSIIQAISTIRKGRKSREIHNEDSRGAKLKSLEDSIANLDNLQGRAVIETVEGVQRIRGLAGSGKTIILALKAAYLHAQHPDWKIAVTFNTRSLKGQFKHLINTFSIEQTSEEPDWEKLQIIHAWGAPGGGDRNGLYYTYCYLNGAPYQDYGTAKRSFGQAKAFEGACESALSSVNQSQELYDAILVDEAQDFPVAFLKLCYEMLKPGKRLVYAYDELQNLNSQSLPSPEAIFGYDENGVPNVSLLNEEGKPQQDITLEKCYRNSRPLLATAHALGFGVYRKKDSETGTGLVQIFENNSLWEEVGYKVVDGELKDGSHVVLSRTRESSPEFLESHSSVDDLIQFKCFDSYEDQADWVAHDIKYNLVSCELRCDDIVVINPDPLTTRSNVSPIRKRLFSLNVNSHLAGVDTSPDVFFEKDSDSVAFTGIYRAKGNEAGFVYIINAQDCTSAYGNNARLRNRLFTAITRSKAWVRVLGVGQKMNELIEEFDCVKKNNFQLEFDYPTEEQKKNINIVNRDMSESERSALNKKKSELVQLLDDLENGNIYPEDLGSDQLERLRNLLGKGD